MAQTGFWQNARSVAQGSPDDQLAQILAAVGQKGASPEDIAALDAQPVAPVSGGDFSGDRSPASFFPTPTGAPIAAQQAGQAAPKKAKVKAVPASPAKAPDVPSNSFDLSNPYPGMLRGHFLDQQHEDQIKNSDQQSRIFFMDPEVQKQRMEQLAQIPEFSEQAKGVKDYKDLLAMEAKRPTPVDLSGALGMADILSNGKYNLRAGYKPPNTEERAKELMGNFDKAQDNQRDYTKSLTALANSGKAGNDIITAATMLMNKDNLGYKDVAKKVAAMGGNGLVSNNLKFDAENEKIMKPYRDAQDGIDKSLGLLNNGSSVSDIAATLQFVKPMVSRLTNFEWSKLGRGATDLESRFKQAFSTLDGGTLTDANRGQYKQALQTLRDINDAIAEKVQADRAGIGAAAGLNSGFAGTSARGHYQSGGGKKTQGASPAAEIHPQDAKPGDVVMGHKRKATGAWNSPDGWEQ